MSTHRIPLLLLLAACGGPDADPLPERTHTPADVGQAEYAYVLGVDGQASIVGGAHFVERIDDRREAYGRYNQPADVHPELIDQALIYDPELVMGATDWFVFPSS